MINQDNTIQGGGNIGQNTLALTNRGTIIANQSTDPVIDPNASGVIDSGPLRAAAGHTLILHTGTFTNFEGATDGTVEALDASTVRLQDGALVYGGTLSGEGVFEGRRGTLKDVTITAGAMVAVPGEGPSGTIRFGDVDQRRGSKG